MHTHSEYSPDSRTPLAEQAKAIRGAGIDVVCATDHNTIAGALRLREMADGFRVIVGEEVSTRDGELLGLFLEREIPRDLSGRNRRYHFRRDALDRVWPTVDAIEIFNAREAFAGDNRRAAAYAAERDLAGAAGSDAHRPAEVGRAYVQMAEFVGRDDFVEALRSGTAHGQLSGTRVHVLTRYDRIRKWLGRRKTASDVR